MNNQNSGSIQKISSNEAYLTEAPSSTDKVVYVNTNNKKMTQYMHQHNIKRMDSVEASSQKSVRPADEPKRIKYDKTGVEKLFEGI